ncbi:glycerophosphoryl diester phosphodiesterase membrane domain-containing protein [Gordonia lacunae]|uniref:glycerophosphoryl diester phosphodiesterase membrane domain-containing protein n=1 Tax=Gordonia lacunae TaxID=417102 RepID=UPI001FC8F9B4|nr:glycerophosphoryl diester phosphodiesterase membrane domain-containing protein [Gordonia lacunae]
MTEPPRVPPPPTGEPRWQPPDVSDEWAPVPSVEAPARSPAPPQQPATVPGPQPAWGSAQWGSTQWSSTRWGHPGSTPNASWAGWGQPPSVSAGVLLQRIFSTTVAVPRVYLGLVGLSWIAAAVPLAFASFWLVAADATRDDPSTWASGIAPLSVFLAVVFVQWIVVAGTLGGVAAHAVTRHRVGSRPTLVDTLRHARRSLPRLLAWTALLGLAIAAAFTPALALFGLGVTSGGLVLLAGSLLLTLVALVPVTWLLVRTAFTAPAVVVDGLSVRDAIARSGSLTADRFWRTFGVLAVMLVLAWVAMTTMMYPFDLVGSIADTWFGTSDSGVAATVLSVIGTVVASMVVQPVLTVVPAVLYDDAASVPTAFPPGGGDR